MAFSGTANWTGDIRLPCINSSATMSSNKPPKISSKDMTNLELYDDIKSWFGKRTPIAIFVDYEGTCHGNKMISADLRKLNRYHNVNVALIVNKHYADVDDEGKKLPVFDERKKKIRHPDGNRKYGKDKGLTGEMIELVKNWYGNGSVFILVFCGDRESVRYANLGSLRSKTTVTTISCDLTDIDAGGGSPMTEMAKDTVEWLIELASKRH